VPKTKIYTDCNNWCSSLHVLHTTFLLLLVRWIYGSTVDRSMYSSGLENMKSKTSSYSFAAGCSYFFQTIKGTVLKNNELSTIVSQLHALALETYAKNSFPTQIECR